MKAGKAKRKYQRRFNSKLSWLLLWPVCCRWKLVQTRSWGPEPSWDKFDGGSYTQAAVAPVKVRGKQYWVAAKIDAEDGITGWSMAVGMIVPALIKKAVRLSFWEQDPHTLELPLDNYRDYPGGVRHHLVDSRQDLRKL